MERKIGEIFEYNGEWHQCVKGNTCNDCAFYRSSCGSLNDKGSCRYNFREDATNVIFKKLEKVGEPYHNSEKKLCQQYKCYINPLVTDEIVYVFADNKVVIEIKQTKEDMEEKKQKLDDLVGLYSSGKITHKEFEKGIRELYEKRSNSEKIGKNLKAFDLQKAKDGKPVCTRDGRKARIICFDAEGEHPIIALVTDGVQEFPYNYTKEGYYYTEDAETMADLMMLPEKKEGWVNVYKGGLLDTKSYPTKKEAFDKASPKDYVDTIKINWSE